MAGTIATVCPVCNRSEELTPEQARRIKTSIAFILNRICPECGAIITEEDIKKGTE